jgi:melanoma-associated antigen
MTTVLGSNSRSFNVVFSEAQKILRNVFGMELAELKSKAELFDEGQTNEADKATGKKKGIFSAFLFPLSNALEKAAPSGPKSYIVRSILDIGIIDRAAQTDSKILEEEAADGRVDDEDGPQPYGSIISWNTCDELGNIGILYTILALVLVNGRVLPEGDASFCV